MKIALLQEKHNEIYSFLKEKVQFSEKEIYDLMGQMQEQNLTMMQEAARQGADIAVTSEAINFPGQPWWSGVPMAEAIRNTQDDLKKKCAQIAKDGKMYIAVGMYRVKEDGRLYNSVLLFDRDGKNIFCYDKNFLVAGAEQDYLTPGTDFPIWESEFGRIGFGICWDMQFPETARAYAKQDADLVICPTWGWESLYAQARAYENGIYVAASMAVPQWGDIEGVRVPSQVISPDGVILGEGSRDKAGVVLTEIADIRDCKDKRSLRIGDLRRRLPEK